MSNKRKIGTKRTLKTASGVVLSVATMVGTAGIMATPAFAANPEFSNFSAASTPSVTIGGNAQVAGNLSDSLYNTFKIGDTLTLTIPTAGVTFSALPTIAFVAASGNASTDIAPTVTQALTVGNTVDTITLTDTASGPAGDSFALTVSNVKYNLASTVTPGAVTVTPTDSKVDVFNPATVTNAVAATLSATQTPTGVAQAGSSVLGDITLTEASKGQVGAAATPYVAISAPAGTTFSQAATVTATGGAMVTSSNAAGSTPGSSATMTLSADRTFQYFYVNTPSTSAGTFTISGVAVTANPGTPLGGNLIYINQSAAAPQDTTAPLTNPSSANDNLGTSNGPAGTSQPGETTVKVTQIGGNTADDTSAQTVEKAFPVGANSVVLATDGAFQDALAANYLAGRLGTGVLVQPGTAPSAGESATAAAQAIRMLGVTTVYVVGGPEAIAPSVVTALQGTDAYQRGGVTPTGGKLQVIRIYGDTADATAQQIAQYTGTPASPAATPGAYNGSGTFNALGSAASESKTGPASGVRTAFVVTDGQYQDALAAGPLSYGSSIPVLLTNGSTLSTEASNAITNLGIKQVYLLGGQAAVANSVVTSLEAQGVSVLRIAGNDATQSSTELAQFMLTSTTNVSGTSTPTGLDVEGAATTYTYGSARADFYTDALSSAAILGAAGSPAGTTVGIIPLIETMGTGTTGKYVDSFLNAAGTAPNGGFAVTTGGQTVSMTTADVFGGPAAQTPSLVQTELNDIAAG